jgi:hypothetical protein
LIWLKAVVQTSVVSADLQPMIGRTVFGASRVDLVDMRVDDDQVWADGYQA